MRRRDFIKLAGGAAAWPLAAHAQQGDRMRHIGVLLGYAENDPETKLRIAAFRLGLAKRGWSEGRNIQIDYRFGASRAGQYSLLAKELLALHPEVLLGHTTPVVAALQQETREIPVVFVNVSDPIGEGFVTSLARPGTNLTGVLHYEPGIVGKWLAMLKEIAPRLERVALVANPKTSPQDYFLRAARAAAPSLAIEIVSSPIENSASDIERVLDAFGRIPNGALVLAPDGTTIQHRDLVVALAAKHRLPAVYPFDFFVKAGGLMSYGTDQNDMFRLAASYVDRILRGDKPSELPVQAPTRFEMSLNLKTAKAMGLTVPPGLIVAADEVIDE
jgi:putative tryptophan/tyrosine transport system substrate-binding protein